jgi:hypothetical protein
MIVTHVLGEVLRLRTEGLPSRPALMIYRMNDELQDALDPVYNQGIVPELNRRFGHQMSSPPFVDPKQKSIRILT